MKRLFIAINLPEEVKTKIESNINPLVSQFSADEAKFVSSDNWHITLIFLGDQKEENIEVISKSITEALGELTLPEVFLESISYGPKNFAKRSRPRMLWANIENKSSISLERIKNALDESLFKNKIEYQKDNRPFSGHITLARFREEVVSFPEVHIKLQESFKPGSVFLIESDLKHSGAEYFILKEFKL